MSTARRDTTSTPGESGMNAVVLERFGGIDELIARQIPVPEVGSDDVLIRVEVAGVGSWDAEERAGEYEGGFGIPSTFPYVLGWDAAGTIAEVGSNVTDFEVGDRVYAATMPVPRGGFYREYGVVEAEYVARTPPEMSTELAGAMAWDALTAQSGLDVLALAPGDSLVVFGASGGIGHMALQLAKHRQIKTFAVASGPDGVELARQLGADGVVDGRKADAEASASEFAPNGFDGGLFTAGGPTAERVMRSIKDSGTIAWPNGVLPEPPKKAGPEVTHFDADRSRASTDRLNAVIEAGGLSVHIAETFPMNSVRDAHRALQEHYIGKLAMRVATSAASQWAPRADVHN